jgi:hypothetical protein
MSVAQLESELASLNWAELEALEAALRREKGRRGAGVAGTQEAALYAIVNEPLPGGEELTGLRRKRDDRTLSDEEHSRLIALENEREMIWARKLRAVGELADLHGEDFQALFNKLGLNLRTES